MPMVPVIWSVWGLVVLFLVALKVYTWRLNRDEDDQIFLDDSFSAERQAQAEIAAKVSRTEPLVRTAFWLVVGMSVVVIAYYIHDMLARLQ